MIYIFLGLPRAGKSYAALCEIVDEIVNGNRVICTNLPINVPELSAYIATRYPEADFDPHKRLRILTDDETKRFWRYRRSAIDGSKLDCVFEFGTGILMSVLTDQSMIPETMFVIDEAHMYFDARNWAKNGEELTAYNSQHGKIGNGDVVIFITQWVELVDKRVRVFAQEYHSFRNLGFERLLWFFRAPTRFLRTVYSSPPHHGVKPVQPPSTQAIDLALAACYDTSAGVGVKGRGTPEKKPRRKGLHWVWLVVGALVVVWLISKGPDYFMKSVISKFRPDAQNTPAPVVQSVTQPTVPAQVAQELSIGQKANHFARRNGFSPVSSFHANGLPVVEEQITSKPPFVVSVLFGINRWRIELSDGRVFSDETGGIKHVNRDFVILSDGEPVPRLQKSFHSRQTSPETSASRQPARPKRGEVDDESNRVINSIVSGPSKNKLQ